VCSLVAPSPDGGGVPAVGDFACIAIDSQYVYVATGLTPTTGGEIYRVPVTGGMPQTIVPMQNRPHGIASDGTNIYWVNYGVLGQTVGTVMKAGLDGSNPTPIAMTQAAPFDIALDSTHVYWDNRGDGSVWQADKDGMNPKQLKSGAGANVGYLAANGTTVFFADATDNAVYSSPVGGTATIFAMSQMGAVGVAFDSTDLFWSDGTGGTIMSQPITGTGSATPIEMARTGPNAVATDGTYVYWSESGGGKNLGSINRTLTTGGAITPLATSRNYPACIALDPTSIYWIDTGGGLISKTAR
jgi:hypothetical protein